MKIIISNAINIGFESKIDLNRLIPDGVDGNPLNYEQGEGQVLIDRSVWGIYCSNEDTYILQYEEGLIDFLTLLALTTRIIEKLKLEFSPNLVFKIEGLLEHQDPHEKDTSQG